jgi:hypothetical protein
MFRFLLNPSSHIRSENFHIIGPLEYLGPIRIPVALFYVALFLAEVNQVIYATTVLVAPTATTYRIVWMDILCILQDPQEDWDDQALIMGEIYGGAFYNLAACTGSDGNSGLYPNLGGISRRMCTEVQAKSCVTRGLLSSCS